MIRSVVGMHGGREQLIFIGITPKDIEHLASGKGLRYSPADMATAGMPPDFPISMAFVWGNDHQEIIAEVTEAMKAVGKEVETVYEKPPRRPSADPAAD